MEKLNLIISKINAAPSTHKFAKKAKQVKIEVAKNNPDQVDSISLERIQGWDFTSEVLKLAFLLEKQDFVTKKLSKKVEKLERHLYSPEQNTLHFKNGKMVRVSGATSIAQALDKITVSMSIEQLREI